MKLLEIVRSAPLGLQLPVAMQAALAAGYMTTFLLSRGPLEVAVSGFLLCGLAWQVANMYDWKRRQEVHEQQMKDLDRLYKRATRNSGESPPNLLPSLH